MGGVLTVNLDITPSESVVLQSHMGIQAGK
jgi:hypothetical protein